MKASLLVRAVVVAVVACSCGSGGNPNSPGSAAPNRIDILGDRGNQSFTPNPAAAAQGDMVVWRNTDSVTHHIVFNDGSLDSGDLAPGASSSALRVGTNGANYHCTIHPGMVGSINRSEGTPPPCSGPYC
jgi:plastocyanin